jgi:murein DD-endopeptidase MepM/ murein hydrolase activator NlpD
MEPGNNYPRNHNNRRRQDKMNLWSIVAIVLIIGTLVVWNKDSIFEKEQPQPTPIATVEGVEPAEESSPQLTAEQPTAGTPTAGTEESEPEAISAATKVDAWLPPANGSWGRLYGYQLDPTFDDYRFHSGVDMPLAEGEPVFAVANGTVVKAADDEDWQGRVEIKHAGGITSVYLGIVPSGVSQGQAVVAGETIGTVAASPRVEALQDPHLHLEIITEEGNQNPLDYIK